MKPDVRIEPVTDKEWLASFLRNRWGEEGLISRGRLRTSQDLFALRAYEGRGLVGLVSWCSEAGSIELMTLDSERPGSGIGTRLLDLVVEEARRSHAHRLWLITTNDNIDALRFYQRRGWHLTALHPGAVAESRRHKPSIPETGAYGIPMRDELELDFPL